MKQKKAFGKDYVEGIRVVFMERKYEMFKPKQVIFEKGARDFPLGEELYQRFVKVQGIEVAEADARIQAAAKVIKAGYPVGFLIAPVFLYENWKAEYRQMLEHLKETLPKNPEHRITFEVISHRYTLRAKERINEIFPENMLPMTEEERTFKYGQFGYGKYLYTKEKLADMKQFFLDLLQELFPECEVKYVI